MTDSEILIEAFSALETALTDVERHIQKTRSRFVIQRKLQKLSWKIEMQIKQLLEHEDTRIKETENISQALNTFREAVLKVTLMETDSKIAKTKIKSYLSKIEYMIDPLLNKIKLLNERHKILSPKEKLNLWGFPIETYPDEATFLAKHIRDCEMIKKTCSHEGKTFFTEALPLMAELKKLNKIYWPGVCTLAKKTYWSLPSTVIEIIKCGTVANILTEFTWKQIVKLSTEKSTIELHLEEFISHDIIKNPFWPKFTSQLVVLAEKNNVNIWYFFQDQGLPALIKRKLLTEETYEFYAENLIKLAKACRSGSTYLFLQIFEGMIASGLLTKETWPHVLNLFKKEIKSSKSKMHMLLHYDLLKKEHKPLAEYTLLYHPSTFLNIVKFLEQSSVLQLKMDKTEQFISSFSRPLLFEADNPDYILKLITPLGESQLERSYEFLCRFANKSPDLETLQKMTSRVASFLSKKDSDLNDRSYIILLEKICSLFAPLLFAFTDKRLENAIIEKIKADFGLEKVDRTLVNELFLESYKRASATSVNSKIAITLLQKFLKKETYPFKSFPKAYPFCEENNLAWCEKILKNKGKTWFKENKRTMNISDADLVVGVVEKMANLKSKAIQICQKQGISFTQEPSPQELITIYQNAKNNNRFPLEVLNTLKLILDGMKSTMGSKDMRSTNKITMYRELHPLKVLMMGEWVNGSCLSYYASDTVYWSTFANASDANKAVFYIEANNKIIGRVLVAITSNRNLIRFPIYYTVNTLNLDRVVDEYLQDFAKKCNLTTNTDFDYNVKCLISDAWDADPVRQFE